MGAGGTAEPGGTPTPPDGPDADLESDARPRFADAGSNLNDPDALGGSPPVYQLGDNRRQARLEGGCQHAPGSAPLWAFALLAGLSRRCRRGPRRAG